MGRILIEVGDFVFISLTHYGPNRLPRPAFNFELFVHYTQEHWVGIDGDPITSSPSGHHLMHLPNGVMDTMRVVLVVMVQNQGGQLSRVVGSVTCEFQLVKFMEQNAP